MSKSQRIFGTSLLSLLLVVVGLFVVCSGRVQDVSFEDELAEDEFITEDLAEEEEGEIEGDEDLIGRLDELDLAEAEGGEWAAEDQSEAVAPAEEAESFLTPAFFDSINTEVGDLSTIAASQTRTIDSLRSELQATNYQKNAQQFAEQTRRNNAKPLPRGVDESAMFNSEFGAAYQDALDDFYVRNYQRAISKFRELVRRGDHPELADNCQYWIGEAYFAMGNYYQAVAEFQKVLPIAKSNKTNDAQLMIGLAFMKAGDADLARTELNTAINFGGGSEAAKKASRYLEMLNNA
jgi:TolA-binding protein